MRVNKPCLLHCNVKEIAMKTSKAINGVLPITRTDPKIKFVLHPPPQRIRNGGKEKVEPGGSCREARRGQRVKSWASISRCWPGRTRENAASAGSLGVWRPLVEVFQLPPFPAGVGVQGDFTPLSKVLKYC